MSDLFLVLPLVALGTLAAVWLWNNRATQLNIKGPRQLPIIGNALDVSNNLKHLNIWLSGNLKLYGPTYHIALPASAPMILTADPQNLMHVLKTNFSNYPKGSEFTSRLSDLLGNGIFNVDGAAWKTQRKTASHIFTMKALRDDMANVFVQHSKILIQQLDLTATDRDNNSSSSSSSNSSIRPSVDIQDMMFRFTLDSICLIAFGIDLHCLTTAGVVPFAEAFDRCQKTVDKRFTSTFWRWSRALRVGDEKHTHSSLAVIDAFAAHVVTERKQLSSDDLMKRTDLLSTFMAIGKNADGAEFTDVDYKDIILNFLIAGRDTTAQTLTWLMYELCLHPDIQQQVFEEVRSVLGNDRNAVPTYSNCSTSDVYSGKIVDDNSDNTNNSNNKVSESTAAAGTTAAPIQNLTFLHCCVLEALRLHPSVPKELKYAVAADTLPDGTAVPAGCAMVLLLQGLMRRTEVWGADAAEYRPQRWQQFSNEPDAWTYPVFQAGPRTCLGKHMALLEAKMCAAMVINAFELSLQAEQVIEEEVALTLPARYGVKVHLTRRF